MADTIDVFGEYAPAYTISNENQHWITKAVSGTSRVLTVTGSGDQALFYHLRGVKQIDTFDITYNARVIQDIKFAAIKALPYLEYSNLLIDLYYSADMPKIPAMQKILPLLPQKTIQVIKTPGNKNIFGAGLDARQYPHNIPSPKEYKKLQKTLKKPFSFIRCDLYDLSAKISGTYDLINISNIFDYCYDSKAQAQILQNLTPHLNIGGHIAYIPQASRYIYENVSVETKDGALKYEKTLERKRGEKMILFQRTR